MPYLRARAVLLPPILATLLLAACSTLNSSAPLPTLYPTFVPTETPQSIAQAPITSSTPDATLAPTATLLPACEEETGQIVNSHYDSDIAGGNVAYRVYLPPCYEASGKSYPVLYMLHGLGDGMNDSQWDSMGLGEAADIGFARGALPPLIIVMPNGTNTHGYDLFAPTNSYEFMILDELIPHIENTYCTWNVREGRAIGGLSRGAFWALEIALRQPDKFSAVGGHSPALFDSKDIPAANDPLELARDATDLQNLRIYIDHGVDDWTVSMAEVFTSRLAARSIEYTYVVNPVGFHNEEYWSAHTADYLSFYTAQWPKDVNALPTCTQIATDV